MYTKQAQVPYHPGSIAYYDEKGIKRAAVSSRAGERLVKRHVGPRIMNRVMTVMQAAIVLIVVGWILNIPGQLQIGLFTEQMLAAVLGLSLALTFLTFPLGMRRDRRGSGRAAGARPAARRRRRTDRHRAGGPEPRLPASTSPSAIPS